MRREAKWWRVEGQRKSIRVTKVNTGQRDSSRLYRCNVARTVSGNNGTVMVNESQWMSVEVNESQQEQLEPRRVNGSQQELAE